MVKRHVPEAFTPGTCPLLALMRKKNAETQAFLQGSKLRLTGYRKVNGSVRLWVRRPENGIMLQLQQHFRLMPTSVAVFGEFCEGRSLTNRLTWIILCRKDYWRRAGRFRVPLVAFCRLIEPIKEFLSPAWLIMTAMMILMGGMDPTPESLPVASRRPKNRLCTRF